MSASADTVGDPEMISPGSRGAGRKRNNPGRSKFGCLTCRTKHVKCDEQLPVCRRCERLGLTCQPYWLKPTSASKKPSPQLKRLRPKESLSPGSSMNSGYPASAHSPASLDDVTETWLNEAPSMDLAVCHDTVDLNDIFAITAASAGRSSRDQQESTTCIGDAQADGFAWLPEVAYPLSASHIPLPNSLVLGKNELDALRHYETNFAISQTSKDPQWSLPRLLLRQASCNTMVMHFALAISLHDLDAQYDMRTDNQVLAHRHFISGSSMFQNAVVHHGGNHIDILACFYYIYIYLSRRKMIDKFRLQKLSEKTLDYIGKLDLESLASISGQAHNTNQAAPNAAIRSFLCRLIVWLYKEDVSCSFSGCAGDVARYVQEKPNLLKAIWEVSRPMLQLNWGAEYPGSQCINDMEMSHVVDMTIELLSLRFDVTEIGHSGPSHAVLENIEAKFNLIETKYFIVFGVVTSPTAPATEMLSFGAAAVAMYYAIRLCYCRYMRESSVQILGIAAEQCLARLLAAAQRATSPAYSHSTWDQLQWALFIGGIETRDAIHRDWIMGKLTAPRFKTALCTIAGVEAQSGKVGMQTISTILRGSYSEAIPMAIQVS
ncbi:hypothetical protein B0J13DRAFT_156155 [Dactylonectria estremocensis]|uniref:Zn(2)-C6 fungal-type domain-containing protein n=1 Tax=Dactylonectria estremocensis TaxID=1079267 RepID=A0A9P9DND9_9HYPO|nr:hypothetical protein B0J13DRAFT_156155 [Dactylonectria estremocensis]